MKKLLLMVLLLTACSVEPTEKTEDNMIPKYLSMLPYKKTDIIDNVLENRLQRVNNVYDGVAKTFADYIADGYTIFDAPASGDIDLTGVAEGKYLVVWKSNNPTAFLTASVAKTITGSGGGLHDDVVIMGVKLNSFNQIIEHTISMQVNLDNSGSNQYFQDKLTFIFCDVELQDSNTTPVKQISLLNNIIKMNHDGSFEDCVIENNYINQHVKGTRYEKTDFNNCYITSTLSGRITIDPDGVDITLKNVAFEDFLSAGVGQIYFEIDANTLSVQNVFIKNTDIQIQTTAGNKNVIFINEVGITGMSASQGNYIFKGVNEDFQVVIGAPSIDFTAITWTDFKTLGADLNIEYRQDNSLYGNQRRNFYTASFQPNKMIYDELKKFDRNHYFVVHRTDVEDELIPGGTGKDIENLTFYDNGTSDEYDFSFDENFLILAEDTSGNEVVLCWYDGALYQTIFSDFWDNTTYTIQKCFQLWDIESMNGLKELIRKPTENTAVDDSPMAGEIVFDNLDNEIVLR